MPVYNKIAGRSLERIAAISDGIFAVAMTLLVLDLKTPAAEAIHSSAGLFQALGAMYPQFTAYVLSFLTLGIFWMGQQSQLSFVQESDRGFSWMHLGYLCSISFLPFSTRLLSEFFTLRAAIFVYWVNLFLPGALLYLAWKHADRHRMLKADLTDEVRCAFERRVLVSQALYAAGALLCLVDNRLAIAVILLLQLNYVFAPRIPLLSRV